MPANGGSRSELLRLQHGKCPRTTAAFTCSTASQAQTEVDGNLRRTSMRGAFSNMTYCLGLDGLCSLAEVQSDQLLGGAKFDGLQSSQQEVLMDGQLSRSQTQLSRSWTGALKSVPGLAGTSGHGVRQWWRSLSSGVCPIRGWISGPSHLRPVRQTARGAPCERTRSPWLSGLRRRAPPR